MPRPAVVRLILEKEFRDLIRDRRTVMLVIILPAVLYPLFGSVGYMFTKTLVSQPAKIGVIGAEYLPTAGSGFPPLLVPTHDAFAGKPTGKDDVEVTPLVVRPLTGDPDEALRSRQADAVLVVQPGFTDKLAAKPGEPTARPTLTVLFREGDDKAKLAARRLTSIIQAWDSKLLEDRFAKNHLDSKYFSQVLTIDDPQADKPRAKKAADEIRDAFSKVFPFILMMWLVAGAIQPAVDMTAGEKERGTMETLLISPAERSEIVFGKFWATTAFAFISVIWNVLWLTVAGVLMQIMLQHPIVSPLGMTGCVVLGLPMAMLFSAVCVALGVFAKSTKEGQYYLLPLVFIAMPLAFWSMSPGIEIGPGNFWVPITGAMLLQQKLLNVGGDPVPWEYFAPVLLSLAVWIGLALAFAVWQFTRESVLFREHGPTGGRWLAMFRRGTSTEREE